MSLPRLAVFDVDGTLIGSDGRCHERTRVALADLRRAGVVVALATGRPLALAQSTIAEVGPVDFVACGNGASLFDCASQRLLRDACLPADMIEPTIQALRDELPGVGFALECGDRVIEEPDFARRVPPSIHDPAVADVLGALAHPGQVRKIIVFHSDYDDDLDGLARLVDQHVDDRVEVQYATMLPIVEIATRGDHKAVALDALIAHIDVAPDEVMAFGDATNDIEMLRWAGVGLAMGNAVPDLKAVADRVIDRIDRGGVAPTIEAMLGTAANTNGGNP